MAIKKINNLSSVVFRGGENTRTERALLAPGSFSKVQNVDALYPGFKKRGGCRKTHSTTLGATADVKSIFQFNKGKVSETHTYAQVSDDDVYEKTDDPPGVTAGAFGSAVHTGSSSSIPASWAVVDDILLYSNGVDQHQIYGGDSSYVKACVKFDGSAAPATVPKLGIDYSLEVAGGSGNAILDSLNTYANNECLFICTPVQAKSLTFTVAYANANASVMDIYYRKSDGTWADTTNDDGTADSGKTLAQTGTASWTIPSDEISHYMYGQAGFWYQIRFTAQLDAEVEISSITFDSQFSDLVDVWDGIRRNTVEVWVEASAASDNLGVNPGTAVNLDELESGADIYIACSTRVQGFYWNVGTNPNTSATTISSISYWSGTAWTSVGTVTDATSGWNNSGWMTFPRITTSQARQFNASIYAHWYKITTDTAAVDADVICAVYAMPFYNVDDYGNGLCNCNFKTRAAYTFSLYPDYVYISAKNKPNVLHGADATTLRTGDGNGNKITAMVPFYNELLVFQEEVGDKAGITLFEGTDPATFARKVITTQVGTFSSKSLCVVDGIMVSTNTEETIKTLCYFISHKGICVTDGLTATIISDPIQNYFDQTETSTCIRRGYEDKMWMAYDPVRRGIRVGLVTGTSATTCNTFFIYDLVDQVWRSDSYAQELSCMANVQAQSGDLAEIQLAGGVDDGFVYQVNYGTNDVSTAIDSYVIVELGSIDMVLLQEYILRYKAQTSGDITLTFYDNGYPEYTRTASMVPKESLSLVKSTYAWTASGSGTNEYYVRLAAGTDPSLTQPTYLLINGSVATEGTVGSLTAGQWDYGDNDTLGYSTVYVRLSDGADPDAKDPGYIAISEDIMQRDRQVCKLESPHISIKVQNNGASESMRLLDIALDMSLHDGV